MSRRVLSATAVVLTSAGMLAAAPTANADIAQPGGFFPMYQPQWRATSVAARGIHEVTVAGVDVSPMEFSGPVHAAISKADGSWREQVLPVEALYADTAVGGSTTWLLAVGVKSTLFRSVNGGDFTKVSLPTLPADVKGWTITNVAAEGGTVAVYGTSRTAEGQLRATSARYSAGAWKVTHATTEHSSAMVNPLLAVSAGRVLANVADGPADSDHTSVYDLTGASGNRLAASSFASSAGGFHTAAWDVKSPTDLTLWGGMSYSQLGSPTQMHTGACKRVVNGVTSNCPAPKHDVVAAVRLADGRTLLGGKDTPSTTVLDKVTGPMIQGAYSLVGTDGTVAPFAGLLGDRVVDLAVEPGTNTVWTIASNGDRTNVSRAEVR